MHEQTRLFTKEEQKLEKKRQIGSIISLRMKRLRHETYYDFVPGHLDGLDVRKDVGEFSVTKTEIYWYLCVRVRKFLN